MKRALTSGTAAVVALMAWSAPAQAQVPTYDCNLTSFTFFLSGVASPSGYAQCAGWTYGNDDEADARAVMEQPGWGFTGVTELLREEGPGGDDEWGTSGGYPDPTFVFGPYSNFVVALKSNTYFSLYHFSGTADAFAYMYNGENDPFQWGLSHYTIYGGNETSVPEPGTLLLLGTGLLGMAALRRRREDVA